MVMMRPCSVMETWYFLAQRGALELMVVEPPPR
jgi:hypothetical protein